MPSGADFAGTSGRDIGFPPGLARISYIDAAAPQEQQTRLDDLAEVCSKLAELKRLERGLKDMIAICDGGDVIDCPILEEFYT